MCRLLSQDLFIANAGCGTLLSLIKSITSAGKPRQQQRIGFHSKAHVMCS